MNLVLAPFVFASKPVEEIELQTYWSVAKRNGRAHCWVQFKSYDAKMDHYTVCIPRNVWAKYLKSDGVICSKTLWRGHQKLWYSKEQKDLKKNFFQVTSIPKSKCKPTSIALGIRVIERWRENFENLLKPYDPLGILRKLVLNQSSEGSAHYFLRTIGFVHLISVAGIHIYALFRWVEILGQWMLLRSMGSYRVIVVLMRALATMLVFLLWLLEGMRPGMLRPIAVVALRRLANGLGFRWGIFTPLTIVCGLDLLLELCWVLAGMEGYWSAGRIHYGLAVWGGLFAVAPEWGKCRRNHLFREHLLLSIGSWIPIAVFDIFETHLFAAFTPILSLLTIPVFTLFTLPSLLICFVFHLFTGPQWVEPFLSLVCSASNTFVEKLFFLSVNAHSLWVIDGVKLVVGLAAFFISVWLPKRGKYLFIVFSLVVCFWRLAPVNSRPVFKTAKSIEQLNIGQGDASLIRMNDAYAGMFDVGSVWALSAEAWFRIFVEREIYKLDWVALSHLDEDHRGGLSQILRLIPVKEVIASEQIWASYNGRRLQGQIKSHRVSIHSWRNSSFPFLYVHAKGSNRPNGLMSGIVVPTACGHYFNFGDASAKDERDMFIRLGKLSPGRRVLKISHHGSRFSSSARFLKEVNPTEVWISCGKRNAFGHPSIEVLKRLRTLRIPFSQTFEDSPLLEDCY